MMSTKNELVIPDKFTLKYIDISILIRGRDIKLFMFGYSQFPLFSIESCGNFFIINLRIYFASTTWWVCNVQSMLINVQNAP